MTFAESSGPRERTDRPAYPGRDANESPIPANTTVAPAGRQPALEDQWTEIRERMGRYSSFLIALLEEPIQGEDAAAGILVELDAMPAPFHEWPDAESRPGKLVRIACTRVLLEPDRASKWCMALRRLLAPQRFEELVRFLSFIRSAPLWTEFHPEPGIEAGVDSILEEHESLARSVPDTGDSALSHRIGDRVAAEFDESRRPTVRAVGRRQSEEALKESEERFARFMRHLPGLAWIKDVHGRYVYVNDAAEKAFRTPRDTLIGKTDEEVFPPETATQFSQNDRQALANGTGLLVVETLEHDDGVLHHSLVSKFPIPGPDGHTMLVGGIAIDITDRKQAEYALRASEERFRTLSDAVPAMVWACRPDGSVFHLNRNWTEYTGLTVEESSGHGWAGTLHPDDRPRVLADWERCTRTKEPYEGEARYRRHDGQYRWHYFRGVPLKGEDDDVAAWYGTSFDIQDRKLAEEALRESEQRFRTFAETAPAMLWITEPHGDCSFLSRGWYEFTGQTKEHALGRGWFETVHPDDRDESARIFADADSTHQPFSLDYRLRRADGEYRWVIDAGRPRFSDTGEFLGFIGSVIDVHERKQAEEALRDADRRKDEFLATLAHELRNPLAPLRNGLQLMKLAEREPAVVDQTRIMMERQLGQMVRLVDDLLDVSRISRGMITLRKERVPLATVVQQALETSRPAIEQGGHQLSIDVPSDPICVMGDAVRLAQVFSNLLNNAAKFTPKGGRVRLSVQRQGSDAVISVRDNGIGIPADMLSRVFDLFTQVDRSLEKSEGGLGIGLSLVARLVHMHDGFVEARSDGRGAGSEFIVRLPLALSATEQRSASETATLQSTTPRRVLVVDDNWDAAFTLAELLRIKGNDTRTAHDGLEALDVAAVFRPDIILLDIGMPKLNGYDVARRIREQPWGRDILLVAQTGWDQEDDRRRSQEAGFDFHLVKPVRLSTLEQLFAGLHRSPA